MKIVAHPWTIMRPLTLNDHGHRYRELRGRRGYWDCERHCPASANSARGVHWRRLGKQSSGVSGDVTWVGGTILVVCIGKNEVPYSGGSHGVGDVCGELEAVYTMVASALKQEHFASTGLVDRPPLPLLSRHMELFNEIVLKGKRRWRAWTGSNLLALRE